MNAFILAFSLFVHPANLERATTPVHFRRVESKPKDIPGYVWIYGDWSEWTVFSSKALIASEDNCWALFRSLGAPSNDRDAITSLGGYVDRPRNR